MEKVIVILTSHRTADVARMTIITRSYSSSISNHDDIIQEQRTVGATLQIPSHLDRHPCLTSNFQDQLTGDK